VAAAGQASAEGVLWGEVRSFIDQYYEIAPKTVRVDTTGMESVKALQTAFEAQNAKLSGVVNGDTHLTGITVTGDAREGYTLKGTGATGEVVVISGSITSFKADAEAKDMTYGEKVAFVASQMMGELMKMEGRMPELEGLSALLTNLTDGLLQFNPASRTALGAAFLNGEHVSTIRSAYEQHFNPPLGVKSLPKSELLKTIAAAIEKYYIDAAMTTPDAARQSVWARILEAWQGWRMKRNAAFIPHDEGTLSQGVPMVDRGRPLLGPNGKPLTVPSSWLGKNGNGFDTATATQEAAKVIPGGIDFAQSNLDLQIKRDGAGVPLPVSQQNLDGIHIDGLVPVILDIKPASTLPLFSEAMSAGASSA